MGLGAFLVSFGVMTDQFRIAFVSGKLGDVDGVSLEVDKWIDVLTRAGHDIYTIAGRYGSPVAGVREDRQLRLEKIAFDSEEQQYTERLVFPHLSRRAPHLTPSKLNAILEEIAVTGADLAEQIYDYVQENAIDVLVAQNTNAMPMTILGGAAMHRLAGDRRIATIFHHHDFWWERSRFSQNRIESLLHKIMPPTDPGFEHVVISSYAAHILSSIKRVDPWIIPNCEDFEHAVGLDDYNSDFRSELGFRERDILVVQPTRIIPRKRIEDSIELLGAFLRRYPELEGRLQFIVSLYQGDEPDDDYVTEIRRCAERNGVPLHLIADRVASVRGSGPNGEKRYTNRDVLANADLVTYLPIWEGFGNALLEAIAARVPVVVSTYLVYKTDIMPLGLRNIEVRDRYDQESGRLQIPESVLDEIHYVLNHPAERSERVAHNFELARQEFGFHVLEKKLQTVFAEYANEIRASRRRLRKSLKRYSV